jgi:hypothetical protein
MPAVWISFLNSSPLAWYPGVYSLAFRILKNMQRANEAVVTLFAKSYACRNTVVRDVRDSDGNKMGTVIETYDGTEAGVIAAAKRATERMYAEYPGACNIESRIGATDENGRPKWTISPNFRHLAEIGTNEARYIWGDVTVEQ